MSGLSSLSGAPSPFGRSEPAAKQAEPKADSMSSLASAPPLSARGGASAASGSTWGAGKKADPVRMSTPVFPSSRGPNADDEDELFPKSRGLVKKEQLRKANSTKDRGSDSDDDFAPPSTTRARGGPVSSSTAASTGLGGGFGSSSGAASRSTTPASTGPAASANPIRAMMAGGDDDDDFLASLAPPSKSTTTASAPAAGTSSTPSAGSAMARAASTQPPRRDHSKPGSASAVTKSVDTLMSFLKEDDILGKPLPMVQEEPSMTDGLADRLSSAGPKRGRRAAGEDATSPTLQDDPLSGSPTNTATAAPAGRISASGRISGSGLTGGSGRLTPAAGAAAGSSIPSYRPSSSSPFEPAAGMDRMESAGPSMSMPSGLRGASSQFDSFGKGMLSGSSMVIGTGAKSVTASRPPAAAPDDESDLSDSDLPGMDTKAARPRSTSPPGASRIPASMPQPQAKKAAGHDSWEMDDGLLPDSSGSRGQAGRSAMTPGAGASAAGGALGGVGSASASSRHPSRLQNSSSAITRAPEPLKSPSFTREGGGSMGGGPAAEDGGDEEPSGYMPSFGPPSSLARSAPSNPFTKLPEGGERQRRVLPDSMARSALGGPMGTFRTKDEEERERTAAAMAAALARREQLQASTPAGGAPMSTAFRLPSERRAIDALSVHINSPAGSTPKPGAAPQAASAGTGAGSRAAGGQGNTKGRGALQSLDSSTDDEMFGPPLQRTKSPAASMVMGTSGLGGMQGAAGRQRGAAAAGPMGGANASLAASAPEASQLGLAGNQQPPHSHMPALSSQASAPPPQLQPQLQVPLGQPQRSNLPPGVSPGTVHLVPQASMQQASMTASGRFSPPVSPSGGQHGGGLPPGVTVLHPAAASAGAQLPPNMVPLAGMPPNLVPLQHAPGATAAAYPQHQQQGLPPGVTQITPLGAPPPGITQITPLGGASMGSGGAHGEVGGAGGVSADVHHAQAAQLKDVTNRVAVLQVEVDRERADLAALRDENGRLKKQVTELEGTVKDKEQQIRDAENRVLSHEARTKLSLAETQALSLKESVAVRSELEDLKAQLARVKGQYADLEQDKAREATRLRGEMDEARQAQAAEVQALKEDIAGMVVAAEARGRRAGLIEKEIAEAQIKAQQAALEEEKEVIQRHRLSAELLAQLTEKVRASASSTWEREERAVRALEREVVDKEARAAARDRALAEREEKLVGRERELDVLRAELNSLARSLESSVVHDKEDMRREQARLARETVRMGALQEALLADKEDLKLQVAMERKLLEEAREARRKEREALISEVAADRRALATEHADVLRQMDASRAELLALKSKLVEYEGRASAALQQALAEEARLAKARKATEEEQAACEGARAAVQADRAALESEAGSLVEYARKLQEQSEELAASNTELQQVKVELVSSRQEVARELAEAKARGLDLEDRARQADLTKKALDQERLGIAAERRALSEERLAASKAASEARDAQMRLAEAVRQWVAQGVPIPFTVESAQGGSTMTVKAGAPLAGPIPSASPVKGGAGAGPNNRRGSMGPGGTRGRNSLRYMLDKLGLDMLAEEAGGVRAAPAVGLAGSHADYIRQQKQFLTQLRMSAPSAGILHPLHMFQAGPAAMGPPAPDFHFMSHTAPVPAIRTSGPSASASFQGFSTAPVYLPSQQPQQQAWGPYASAMPPGMMGPGGPVDSSGAVAQGGYGAYAAAAGPRGPQAGSQQEHSDTTDRHTALSSDFPAMVPVSSSTSEHEGGHSGGSEGERTPHAIGADFGMHSPSLGGREPANRQPGTSSTQRGHISYPTIPEGTSSSTSSTPHNGCGMQPALAAVGVGKHNTHDSESEATAAAPQVAAVHAPGAKRPVGEVPAQGRGQGRLADLSDTAVSPLRSAGVRTPSGSSGSGSQAPSELSAGDL